MQKPPRFRKVLDQLGKKLENALGPGSTIGGSSP